MEYNFKELEPKWQQRWRERGTYHVEVDPARPKYYVLDMFPYPSGAGLHVGHPLGYIASDIFSRYKRQCGFNVLHPMGYDAFGLPAEQYAIQTGQHPAVTTEHNIARYREQLDKIGFSFDWDREVRTCDPGYYKWTQWAFLKMFGSYYCRDRQQARPIGELEEAFARSGTEGVNAACTAELHFTAADWAGMDEHRREQVLQNYRLAYRADTMVNWCPQLGTVLANDEVKDGLSVRGGYPVVQKRMKQWLLRVTAYAQRMLDGLETLQWSESLKEIQRNWIGRSEGAQVFFDVRGFDRKLEIFTTRPDTIFGITFMTLAPEHPLVEQIPTPAQREQVQQYVRETSMRSERERMADVGRISGVFTGAYAVHPFTGKHIPIYIGDYVLAGYGTGAVMAVPAGDTRDYAFAKHFGIPILPIVKDKDISQQAYTGKDGIYLHDFIQGDDYPTAVRKVIARLEQMHRGRGKIQYRMRDAVFSRQRYWGEPFPVYYKDGIPHLLDEKDLPAPRLECIITSDEEIGMLGAAVLQPTLVTGRNMINLDSEAEGVFTVSCAGGNRTYCRLPIQRETVTGQTVTLRIAELVGGHSGVEIDKGRANADMLLGRLVMAARRDAPCRLISLTGGSKDNAIPNEAIAQLLCEDLPALERLAAAWQSQLRHEYAPAEPDLTITVTPNEKTACAVLTEESAERVLCMLLCVPNGIQAMSGSLPGLVQTSLNLGILTTEDDAVELHFGVRSSVASQKEMLTERLTVLTHQLGGTVEVFGDYPAWEYRAESPLRELMCEVYREQYGAEPKIEAIHAGLECGLLCEKLPGLDCVSIGPELLEIHTARERMSVESVGRVWRYVREVLRRSR